MLRPTKYSLDSIFLSFRNQAALLLLLGLLERLFFSGYQCTTLAFAALASIKVAIGASKYYNIKIYSNAPFRLAHDDVVVVVGGSHGLGLELASCFAEHHHLCKICVVDISPIERPLARAVKFYQCDISSDDWRSTLEKIEQEVGRVTVLLNCAGIKHTRPLIALSQSDIQRVFQVNFFAHLESIRFFIQRRLKDHGQLFVVNIALVLGLISPANLGIYSASKAALIAAHESLFHELHNSSHHHQIKMLLVKLGQLDTQLFDDVEPPRQFLAPVLSHVEVARTIYQRVCSGEVGDMTLPFYGRFVGAMRMLPLWLTNLLRNFSGIDGAVVNDR